VPCRNIVDLSALLLPLALLQDLGAFLMEKRLVELMLGEEQTLREAGVAGTHLELLKRSEDALLFLAKRRLLDERLLDALWGAAADPLQERVVYALLCTVLRELDPALLPAVERRLQAFPRALQASR
ncbi:MAG: hypothetical protein AAFY46_11710, partial [Planctomycetota bacterium]